MDLEWRVSGSMGRIQRGHRPHERGHPRRFDGDGDGQISTGGGVGVQRRRLTSLYPTFFSPKPVRSDMSFMTPRGLLRFDPKRSRYTVSSDEKLVDETHPGNLMSMSPGSCDLRQHGVGHSRSKRNTCSSTHSSEKGLCSRTAWW